MAFTRTNLMEVLEALESRVLQAGFDASDVDIAMERPEPGYFTGASSTQATAIIYPTGGDFDQDAIDGGGGATRWCTGRFAVEIFTPQRADQAGRDREFLRTMSSLFAAVIEAICPPYALLKPNTDAISIEDPRPTGYSMPLRDENNFGSMIFEFEVKYVWASGNIP